MCRERYLPRTSAALTAFVRAPDATGAGEYVLERDNLRVPSGVDYMLEDRKMMMRLFPELFSENRVAPRRPLP
jgi:uncharacterized circularly permuted ATP-grasp superfamily protein